MGFMDSVKKVGRKAAKAYQEYEEKAPERRAKRLQRIKEQTQEYEAKAKLAAARKRYESSRPTIAPSSVLSQTFRDVHSQPYKPKKLRFGRL